MPWSIEFKTHYDLIPREDVSRGDNATSHCPAQHCTIKKEHRAFHKYTSSLISCLATRKNAGDTPSTWFSRQLKIWFHQLKLRYVFPAQHFKALSSPSPLLQVPGNLLWLLHDYVFMYHFANRFFIFLPKLGIFNSQQFMEQLPCTFAWIMEINLQKTSKNQIDTSVQNCN